MHKSQGVHRHNQNPSALTYNMLCSLPKSNIRRKAAIPCELDHKGIGESRLKISGVRPHEQRCGGNITKSARLVAYAVSAAGSGHTGPATGSAERRASTGSLFIHVPFTRQDARVLAPTNAAFAPQEVFVILGDCIAAQRPTAFAQQP